MIQPPRNAHKKAFDAIASEACRKTRAYLETLSDAEAKEAAAVARRINRVNCYWYLWDFREILLEEIRSDDCRRSNARKAARS